MELHTFQTGLIMKLVSYMTVVIRLLEILFILFLKPI